MLSRRALLAAAATVPLLAGCVGPLDARAYAQRVADQEFPGKLRVIRASWEPGLIGFPQLSATWAFTDDPDGVVSVSGNAKLAEAYRAGRWAAAEFRALRHGFVANGLEPLTIGPISIATTNNDTLAASLTLAVDPARLSAINSRVDAAVTGWLKRRDTDRPLIEAHGVLAPFGRLQIGLLPLDRLPQLPAVDGSLPSVLAMAERRAAARSLEAFAGTISPRVGKGIVGFGEVIGPKLADYSAIVDFEKRILARAAEPAKVKGVTLRNQATWRLESATSLRCHAPYCLVANCGREPDGILAFSLDLTTERVSAVRTLTGRNALPGGPLEPERL